MLMGIATNAAADTLKFENPNAVIRLLDKPCALDVPEKASMKLAVGDFTVVARTPFGMFPMGREDHAGCWKRVSDGYETVWDDGEKIKFPLGEGVDKRSELWEATIFER